MRELLAYLLTAPPDPLPIATIDELFRAHRARASSLWAGATPFDRAVALALSVDRLGYAFAGGYHAALRALAPSVPEDRVVAFCATEDEGAHPRAIRTSLTPALGGGFSLRGRKRWATLAPSADELLVVASVGVDASSKNRLRVARVASGAAGVTVTPMPPPPFAPEIPHAEVELAGVEVGEGDVLPGDGYDDYVKPFRTIEDVHVHAALLGYLAGVARRSGFPARVIERLAALVVCARSIAALDPKAPEAHVALSGLLEQARGLVATLSGGGEGGGGEGGGGEEAGPALWESAPPEERARWERDKSLLRVAERAREARRERAWQALSGGTLGRGDVVK